MADELLRSVFSEDVPAWERLEPQLREWLGDSKLELDDIRERIFEYIQEQLNHGKFGEEWADAESEAMNRAFSVVDGLIENLPVDEVNCQRLKAYIKEMDCLAAYDRLLTDYRGFLSVEEHKQILAKGKRCFVPEVTADWE
jgi:hypothetical protein